MKRILITGASGFVGSHLVDVALSEGLEVYAGIRATSSRKYLRRDGLHFFEVDFGKPSQLQEDLQEFANKAGGFHYVIQNAGVTRPRQISEFEKGNADFTHFLAEAALETQPELEKFVFMSSLAALGPAYEGVLHEDSPAKPLTPYGRSKLLGEEKLKSIEGLPYIILRPTGVYGPRDKNFGQLVDMVRKGWDVRLAPDTQRLSFIHVLDLARATLALTLSEGHSRSYNITDGQVYSPSDFGRVVSSHCKVKSRKIRIPKAVLFGLSYLFWAWAKITNKALHLSPFKMKELTAPSWEADISAIRTAIGYAPNYDLDTGLAEYIDWYMAQEEV